MLELLVLLLGGGVLAEGLSQKSELSTARSMIKKELEAGAAEHAFGLSSVRWRLGPEFDVNGHINLDNVLPRPTIADGMSQASKDRYKLELAESTLAVMDRFNISELGGMTRHEIRVETALLAKRVKNRQ